MPKAVFHTQTDIAGLLEVRVSWLALFGACLLATSPKEEPKDEQMACMLPSELHASHSSCNDASMGRRTYL